MTDINRDNVKNMESEYSDSVLNKVAKNVLLFSNIRWKTIKFTINQAPEPSHRPRLSGYRIYVPGAARKTAFFSREVLPTLGGVWIDKPCKVHLSVYVKTPSSFSKVQTMLAEMKLIRPWAHIGDIDNFEKTILDQICGNSKRGHVGIMADDCIVIDMNSHKYYSINPRTEVEITYMDKIPKDLEPVLRLHQYCSQEEMYRRKKR